MLSENRALNKNRMRMGKYLMELTIIMVDTLSLCEGGVEGWDRKGQGPLLPFFGGETVWGHKFFIGNPES